MGTIAITAPEKFDLQDLVCAELVLRFDDAPSFGLMIEPMGGEDAMLTLAGDAGVQSTVIEVQVKGAAGAVRRKDIAEWLTHFPPHRSEGCFLDRLLNDPSRLALIVASGRCDDAASLLVEPPDWSGHPHNERRIKIADAREFLNDLKLLGSIPPKATALEKKRAMHIASVAAGLTAKTLRDALRRTVVLERVTASDLRTWCQGKLQSKYRIPADRTVDLLNQCLGAVKEAKSKSLDVVPAVRALLEKSAPLSLFPIGYVERGEESSWVAALSRDCVLLLSGPARCGKSEAARRVASEFQLKGYAARIGSDVEEAERYLLDETDGQRLYLIDDPLGGIHMDPGATRALTKLRGTIPRLRPNRKLIVAQNQAQLFEIISAQTLEDCALGKCQWHNLEIIRPEFLERTWISIASALAVPQTLRDTVATALSTGKLTLELGCLRHLASTYDRLPPRPSLDDISRRAREDAAELGQTLSEDANMEAVLGALAVGSTPVSPIALQELAFILGGGGDLLPALQDSFGIVVALGGSSESPPPPSYEQIPVISEPAERCLERLERRRFLSVLPDQRIALAHPYYQSAAEFIFQRPTIRLANVAVRFATRGLFCLAPSTTRCVARNLQWLFDRLSGNHAARENLVRCAIDGLRSIFPATRDLCFRFLVQRFSDLPADLQDDLPNWVAMVTHVSLEYVRWHAGEAWLPTGRGTAAFAYTLSREASHNEGEARAHLQELELSTDALIEPARASQALLYCAESPDQLSTTAMARFLSFDEAMIRAEASRVWLASPRSDDSEQLRRIFDDDHPSVAIGALEGCVGGWWSCDTARQAILLDGLERAASPPWNAAALFHKLIVFNRIEFTGDRPPWSIFGRLMPLALRVLPRHVTFTDARLYSVIEDSARELPAEKVVEICEAWADWLQREIDEAHLPSDYALGVIDVLLSATQHQPQLRRSLFHRLLAFRSTGALMVLLKDLVDAWTGLNEEEKSRIFALLAEQRDDARWLRAVVITRADVPAELQAVIFGRPDALSSSAPTLVAELAPEILEAAVSIYCGRPQPLWWLGTHHSNSELWEQVVRTIELDANHPLFELVLDEAVFHMDSSRVAEVVRAAGPANAARLFDLLLRHKAAHTGNWLAEAWALLFTYAPDDPTKQRWFDRMAAVSPAILDDLSDIRLWLSDRADQELLWQRLQSDTAVAMLIVYHRSVPNPTAESKAQAVADISGLIALREPRLHGTYSDVVRLLDAFEVRADELRATLEQLRRKALDEHRRIKEEMRFHQEPPRDWIGP